MNDDIDYYYLMTYYGGCVERDDIDKYEELGNLVQTVISSLGREWTINKKGTRL